MGIQVADHYNCAIAAHTHNMPLPDDRAHELTDTLGLMTRVGYLRMAEVPAIPQLQATPAAVTYARLGAIGRRDPVRAGAGLSARTPMVGSSRHAFVSVSGHVDAGRGVA